MNALERFHWWFSGKVAETIEENYDDTADAILFPLFSALFAFVCVYSAVQMMNQSNSLSVHVGALFAGVGFFCAILFVVTVAASITFAQEWTQPERRFKEVE